MENTFKLDVVFVCFHHQVKIPISNRALLVGFLMIWLKRYVVPTLSHEFITDVVYLVVLLAYGQFLALLPAMMG